AGADGQSRSVAVVAPEEAQASAQGRDHRDQQRLAAGYYRLVSRSDRRPKAAQPREGLSLLGRYRGRGGATIKQRTARQLPANSVQRYTGIAVNRSAACGLSGRAPAKCAQPGVSGEG